MQLEFHRCSEEGCTFVTDDLGEFVEHAVDERLRKLSSTAPTEETKRRHTTAEEFLECPDCFPQIEKAFLERGWKKPEPKPERDILELTDEGEEQHADLPL